MLTLRALVAGYQLRSGEVIDFVLFSREGSEVRGRAGTLRFAKNEGGCPVGKIVLEVPEELKGLAAPLRKVVEEAREQVARSRSGRVVEYEQFEGRLRACLGAVEAGVHAATLAALDIDAAAVLIDGERYVRVGRHAATYRTQTGELALERTLYRRREGETAVDLVSLRAGVVGEGWLPGAARQMAFLLQQGTSREAEQTARQMGRLPYSRSSFEDVGHAVGERYVERHVEIEQRLVEATPIPKEARSVSVALDRVSVPMEEPRPRPAGRARKDAPKRPIARVYHMAYCGTVTLHDSEGKALSTIRYGTMPDGDAQTMCMGLSDDVMRMRRRRRDLRVMLLGDGAPENWNLLGAEFDDGATFGVVSQLIDFWHLIEKLSAAAKVVHGAGAAVVVAGWKMSLLNRKAAASEILDELLAAGHRDVRVGDGRPVHDAITYLENNGHRMNYAGARRRGLPIGSGNVEATCKTLVGQRMKRCGARWKTRTGEHVIHLRALALSDRWDAAMNLTLRPHHAKVRVAA